MIKTRALRYSVFVFLILAIFTNSGCEPLRKKFVRKKKDDQGRQINVILDPQDYPEQTKTPLDAYRQHYQLWKIWEGELSLAIEEARGDKKVLAAVERMQIELNAMQKILPPAEQKALESAIEDLTKINAEYEKGEAIRNRAIVSSVLNSHRRNVKNNFSPDKIKDLLPAT